MKLNLLKFFLTIIKRMAIVTSSNFNIENVMFGIDIKTCGYGVQKILIKYQNRQNSLYVVVPNVLSYGV